MVKLDVLSDPICPWCYIGKTQLDAALEKVGDHPFEIEWHPFQLNPDMPEQGMDRREYLERKFGGKDGAVRVYSQIEEHATPPCSRRWRSHKRFGAKLEELRPPVPLAHRLASDLCHPALRASAKKQGNLITEKFIRPMPSLTL